MLISVITPVYNRSKLLLNLSNSLMSQTDLNFEWVVVDDGSSDDPRLTIESIKPNCEFDIKFFEQDNMGKHVAVMNALRKSVGDYICIVDSDDELLPNAIEIFKRNLTKYPNFKVFLYLKSFMNDEIVGDEFECEAENVTLNRLLNIKGDKLYVFNRVLVSEAPFPIYNGEKFVTESFMWNKILLNSNAMGMNFIAYKGDYLDDGLTSDYQTLLKKNPNGTFKFVIDNIDLDKKSFELLKQSAYHFQSIISLKTITDAIKLLGIKSVIKLVVLTLIFKTKEKIKK